MRKLSKWAKNNPNLSRLIIAFSHLFVVVNAICLGMIMFILNWGESKWLLAIIANLFFLSYIFYPKKSKGKFQFRSSYLRQKTHDFSLVTFYAIVIAFGVNNLLTQSSNENTLHQLPTAEFMVYDVKSEDSFLTRKKIKSKIKELRKQIKHELRELKNELKAQDNKTGVLVVKILLTLLTIGIGLFLGTLIAALSCNLSCSGQEGLAWVVLVLGWGGIIWLGIIAIKYIFRKIGANREDAANLERI